MKKKIINEFGKEVKDLKNDIMYQFAWFLINFIYIIGIFLLVFCREELKQIKTFLTFGLDTDWLIIISLTIIVPLFILYIEKVIKKM